MTAMTDSVKNKTPKPVSKSRQLDQFYTNPEYAKQFINKIDQTITFSKYDIILEPSAGNGSFYHNLDTNKRIGLDIDPKADDIINTNFFEWAPPEDKLIATVGNPPFGKNSVTAIKFFNYAATFSETISFIVPKTFRKASVINRLDKKFKLIYDEEVPINSFIFNDKPYDVPCCSQIWIKTDEDRPVIKTFKIQELNEYFEIVEPACSDFAIQRVGSKAGIIKIEDRMKYSKQSNFFIKAHHPFVLEIFKQVNFEVVKYNTAGNPSISPSELVELWLDKANEMGYNITLKTENKL